MHSPVVPHLHTTHSSMFCATTPQPGSGAGAAWMDTAKGGSPPHSSAPTGGWGHPTDAACCNCSRATPRLMPARAHRGAADCASLPTRPVHATTRPNSSHGYRGRQGYSAEGECALHTAPGTAHRPLRRTPWTSRRATAAASGRLTRYVTVVPHLHTTHAKEPVKRSRRVRAERTNKYYHAAAGERHLKVPSYLIVPSTSTRSISRFRRASAFCSTDDLSAREQYVSCQNINSRESLQLSCLPSTCLHMHVVLGLDSVVWSASRSPIRRRQRPVVDRSGRST